MGWHLLPAERPWLLDLGSRVEGARGGCENIHVFACLSPSLAQQMHT